MNRNGNTLRAKIIPPAAFLLLLAAAWWLLTALLRPPDFLFPGPAAVLGAARSILPELAQATWITGRAALMGFVLSCLVGITLGMLFAQFRLLRSGCYPFAIVLQTVPVVAIAPLLIIWFGTGLRSVVLVSFVVCLFPMIVNATTGMTTVETSLRDLFAIYRANRWQYAFKLRIPGAVPFLLAGARTASGLSVIGAIVGEFFAGYGAREHGLGYIITVTSSQLKTAELFAAIGCSTLLGLCIFASVHVLSTRVMHRWYSHLDSE